MLVWMNNLQHQSFFPSLDANGMEEDLFKRKFAYPYEKGKTIESFYNYFSTCHNHIQISRR